MHLYTADQLMRLFGFDRQAQDGSAASGNWGHAGRPGKRGGSAKASGGSALRAQKSTGQYYGVKKTEHFTSATEKAKKTFSASRWSRGLSADQNKAIADQHAHLASVTGSKQSIEDYKARIFSMLRGGSEQTKRPQNKPVDVVQACSTYVRDKSVPHQIKDVLHQQGFDGAAKVVSKAQMDKMLKQNPTQPVFYRSYTAPSKQVLDAYDDQMEHADWYVDCGTGGAQYGQGMYTAGVYQDASGTRVAYKSREQRQRGALEEMKHYKQFNQRKAQKTIVLPDGVQRHGNGVYSQGQQHKFSDSGRLPEQGQVVVLKLRQYYSSGKYFKYKDGQFVQCDKDKKEVKYPDSFPVSRLRQSYVNASWIKASEWKPEPATSIRKMILRPDAKILKIRSKYGDESQLKEIVKKANSMLKKYAQKSIPKEQMRDDVAGYIDKTIPDPKTFMRRQSEYVAQAQRSVEMHQERLRASSPGTWAYDFYSRRVQDGKRHLQSVKNQYGKLKSIFDSQSYPGQFFDKIRQQAKWKALHAYLGKKACPFKQQMFTPQQQLFLQKYSTKYPMDGYKKNMSTPMRMRIAEQSVRDPGAAAALLGYDAINAIDHGQSGSYTVILNRTKLIIQDDFVDISGVIG